MFILTGSSVFYLKLIATLEEVDCLQLFLHSLLLLIGHIAEWSTVWTQIEAINFMIRLPPTMLPR